MEGSNSSRTNCLSPQIDLYFVKTSKICLVLAVGNLTLSTRAEEDEDVEFLLALALYVLPTLGAMFKVKEKGKTKTETKNQGQIASDRVKAQINMKF